MNTKIIHFIKSRIVDLIGTQTIYCLSVSEDGSLEETMINNDKIFFSSWNKTDSIENSLDRCIIFCVKVWLLISSKDAQNANSDIKAQINNLLKSNRPVRACENLGLWLANTIKRKTTAASYNTDKEKGYWKSNVLSSFHMLLWTHRRSKEGVVLPWGLRRHGGG